MHGHSRRWARLAGMTAVAALALSTAACSGVTLQLPDAVAGGVAGVLFIDRDHDGKHDSDEPTLPDWQVGIYGTGPLPLQETMTDAEGRFTLAEVKGLTGDAATLKYAPHVDAPGAFDESTSQLHLHLDVRLGQSIPVPVDDFAVCEKLEDCDVALPDLEPVLELGGTPNPDYPGTRQWYLDTEEQPGRVLMRFASMTSNMGRGLLHFTALEPASNATTQPVQQRIYGEHEVFVRTAGEFVYHPEHDHIHLDDFESYELELRQAGTPTVVATGTKVSFCLTDIAPVPGHEAAPTALSLDIVPLECGEHEQGISAGWTDYYGPLLADQWIDVTDVPTGDYELVFTSDPDNVILEADETNNVVSFPLHYTNPLEG